MADNLSDVVVHIDETLGPEQLKTLEQHLHDLDGVVTACGREDRPHLITVTYNRDHLDAREILQNVRNEGCGAELVGM